jgi:uncharacterized membrane protein
MNVGVFLSALSGAGVEFFETAAIAYAIARSGYRREAVWGTISGLIAVGVAAAIVGTGLQVVPIRLLQVVIGVLLLWFGWGWTKKSVLRQARGKRAGWVINPLEAEEIVLEHRSRGFSRLNFVIMAKSAALEGLEVAIIVITLGLASSAWTEALWGAAIAFVLTTAIVAILHGHLLKVPDVLIKLGAGISLLAFGTFWLGEGIGIDWQIGDWAILLFAGLYSLMAVIAIRRLRGQSA